MIDFSKIAAYEGDEIVAATERVLNDRDLNKIVRRGIGRPLPKFVKRFVLGMLRRSKDPLRTFDRLITFQVLHHFQRKSTHGIYLHCEQKPEGSRFYITNHRDIILDAAFLSLLLRKKYNIRPYIGVGNNLFGKPWIEDIMRLLRCFAVIRNGSGREVMQNAERLSAYIAHLRERGESMWLAQRQGRAKDGNDTTQSSVLKMLTLAVPGDLITALQELHITPVSITYEYDPCDYLKAREMQAMRDNPAYKKTAREDMLNMQVGLNGQKGEVHFVVTPCINDELEALRSLRTEAGEPLTKNDILREAASIIDRHIFAHYHLAWTNTAALDILNGHPNARMEAYLQERIQLVEIDNRDDAFLRAKLLEMYANPARNQLTIDN